MHGVNRPGIRHTLPAEFRRFHSCNYLNSNEQIAELDFVFCHSWTVWDSRERRRSVLIVTSSTYDELAVSRFLPEIRSTSNQIFLTSGLVSNDPQLLMDSEGSNLRVLFKNTDSRCCAIEEPLRLLSPYFFRSLVKSGSQSALPPPSGLECRRSKLKSRVDF